MITIYFCQICQHGFRPRKGPGGRTLCKSCWHCWPVDLPINQKNIQTQKFLTESDRTMNFDCAIEYVREGRTVRRRGWKPWAALQDHEHRN